MDDPANSMAANMRRAGEFCKPVGADFALTIYMRVATGTYWRGRPSCPAIQSAVWDRYR